MNEYLVVLITAPSADKAAEIGGALVEERLAACVSLVPGVRSLYRWEGRVCDDQEVLMIAKTMRPRFEALKARVLSLHPYEVPEILALGIEDASASYLRWVAGAVGPDIGQ